MSLISNLNTNKHYLNSYRMLCLGKIAITRPLTFGIKHLKMCSYFLLFSDHE